MNNTEMRARECCLVSKPCPRVSTCCRERCVQWLCASLHVNLHWIVEIFSQFELHKCVLSPPPPPPRTTERYMLTGVTHAISSHASIQVNKLKCSVCKNNVLVSVSLCAGIRCCDTHGQLGVNARKALCGFGWSTWPGLRANSVSTTNNSLLCASITTCACSSGLLLCLMCALIIITITIIIIIISLVYSLFIQLLCPFCSLAVQVYQLYRVRTLLTRLHVCPPSNVCVCVCAHATWD